MSLACLHSLLCNALPIGGGLANGHVSPGVIRCGLVPGVSCYLAFLQRFVYPLIDRLAVGFCLLFLRLGQDRKCHVRLCQSECGQLI